MEGGEGRGGREGVRDVRRNCTTRRAYLSCIPSRMSCARKASDDWPGMSSV